MLRAIPATIGLLTAAAASLSAEPGAPSKAGPRSEQAGPEGLPPPPRVLVQVGESCITSYGVRREVDIMMRGWDARRRKLIEANRWSKDEQAGYGNLRATFERGSRDRLVGRALMAELAREAGYKPNERELEARLRGLIRKAGSIDALVQRQGRNLDGIREQLRLEVLQRRFSRSLVPQAAGPGPREVRRYYEANRAALKAPSSVRVRIIHISSGSDPKAAFERADALRRELRFAPERFEERAREVSAHKETAARGGLLVEEVDGKETDWIPLNVLARHPAVAATVRQLSPGKISNVVSVKNGFLLVKLEDHRKGRELALAEAAERITTALARAKEDRLVGDWLNYYLMRTYYVDGDGRRIGAPAHPDRARGIAGRAETVEPDNAEGFLARGVFHARKGDLARAIDDFTKAIELKPDYSEAYDNRGAAHAKKRDLARAIADCTKAIELKPDNAEAYSNRGVAYAYKGDLDLAIADLTKAIELKPDDAKARANRAAIYAKRGAIDRAKRDLERAIKLDPKGEAGRKARESLRRLESGEAEW